jgi:hypothetical protein
VATVGCKGKVSTHRNVLTMEIRCTEMYCEMYRQRNLAAEVQRIYKPNTHIAKFRCQYISVVRNLLRGQPQSRFLSEFQVVQLYAELTCRKFRKAGRVSLVSFADTIVKVILNKCCFLPAEVLSGSSYLHTAVLTTEVR